ncbi:hypothetical protein FQA39_LY12610 [Lamprigera yunnana]|nr:hypothetical protein FQA39_LY12610 [Lamprigera yunnana]
MYNRYECSIVPNNSNSNIHPVNSELQAIFGDHKCAFEFISIDGRQYQKNLAILEADVLINRIRKNWVQIEDSVLEDTPLSSIDIHGAREQIVKTLDLFCCSAFQDRLGERQINVIGNTIQRWSHLNERLLSKLTSATIRNEQQPISAYFHTYLDTQWLLLSLRYLSGIILKFDELLKDLVVIFYAVFMKNGNISTNPFICTCIKRLLVLLLNFGVEAQINFWETFNAVVKGYDEVFVLWLLYNVAQLQGYNKYGEFIGSSNDLVTENFALIETSLKAINAQCSVSKENNVLLLNCCKMIYPLINEWWIRTPKSEPYQLLWEIFNKHLNILLDTQLCVDSAGDLLEIVKNISSTTKNSFEYFLYMLRVHLTNYPNQWAKIRGRIYSKLSNNKIKDLTNVGLHNIAILFLSLVNDANIGEITDKLLSFTDLTQVNQIKPLTLHTHMCLIILHIQQGKRIDVIATPLVKFVQKIVDHRDKHSLMRSYIDGFDSILNGSTNFCLGQQLMLENWVSKYLTCCPFSDLCYFLNVLQCAVRSLRQCYAWSEWVSILKQNILPGLKSIATSATCPSQVGSLAALIDSKPTSDYVLIFTSDPIMVNVTCHFITTLLENAGDNYSLPKNHETAILHAWVRCCLLDCDGVNNLTKSMSKLAVLSEVFEGRSTWDKTLCGFIQLLSTSNSELINSRELCEQCFGRLDAWIAPFITTPANEAAALHIYNCTGYLFFRCSAMLYHKNRSNCLLNRLVNILLLSTDILMGKTPHVHILNAIQHTWHLFMYGIYILVGNTDAYIERTLRDMVVRYLPLLSTNLSPILICFSNELLAKFILERISVSFLLYSSRSSEINTIKALQLIESALESTSNPALIISGTLPGIFEVIIFQNNKSAAISLVKHIANNQSDEVKELIKKSFISVTEKHLAFHTNNYFQFTNILVKVLPLNMPEMLQFVKKQIVEVEHMRGVGYDNILRQGLNRLESCFK